MYEQGSYCVYRNTERVHNTIVSDVPTKNSGNMIAKSFEQAVYYQTCPRFNHHVPFSLLQEHLLEGATLTDEQQLRSEGRWSVDSRILACSHGTEKLLMFAAGRGFNQLMVKPIRNCLNTPANRAGRFCKGFSIDLRGSGPVGSISWIGRDRTTWGEPNAAHVLAATDHELHHLRTVRLPGDATKPDVPPTSAATDRGNCFEEPFSTILEPLQQWKLREKIKQVATFAPPGAAAGGFGGAHLASVLTEQGHIYQWDPQGGIRAPSGSSSATSPFENSRRHAWLEYANHPQTLYLALGESVYSCDYRCRGPGAGSAGMGATRAYSLEPGTERGASCIYYLGRCPTAHSQSVHPQQYFASTSAAELLLVDMRFPRGCVDRRVISRGGDVYKQLRTIPDPTPTGEAAGAVMLLGATSPISLASCPPSKGIDIHTVTPAAASETGASDMRTAPMLGFLGSARPYGLNNRAGFGARWSTRSFGVADGPHQGPRYPHGGKDAMTANNYLCGLALVDVNNEHQELQRLHRQTREDTDARPIPMGVGSGGQRYLLCHQLNASGDIHIEALTLGEESASCEKAAPGGGSRVHVSSSSSRNSNSSSNSSNSNSARANAPTGKRPREENGSAEPPGLYVTSGVSESNGAALAPSGEVVPPLSPSSAAPGDFVAVSLNLLSDDPPRALYGEREMLCGEGARRTRGARSGTGRVLNHAQARRQQIELLAITFIERYHCRPAGSTPLARVERRWRALWNESHRARLEDRVDNIEHVSTIERLHHLVCTGHNTTALATATAALSTSTNGSSNQDQTCLNASTNGSSNQDQTCLNASANGSSNQDQTSLNAASEFIMRANSVDAAGPTQPPAEGSTSTRPRVTLWEVTKYLNAYILPFVSEIDSSTRGDTNTDVGSLPPRPVVRVLLVREYLGSELLASAIGAELSIVESTASYSSGNYAVFGDGLAMADHRMPSAGWPTGCHCALGLGQRAGAEAEVNMCDAKWGAFSACPAPHLICYSVAPISAHVDTCNGELSGSSATTTATASAPNTGPGAFLTGFSNSQDIYSRSALGPVGATGTDIATGMGSSDVTADIISSLRGVW